MSFPDSTEPNEKWGIRRDDTIEFTGYQSIQKYPGELRGIEFFDDATGKPYPFITNNFNLAASTIAGIYMQWRQIELFFKWIKQNLKIKRFLGTGENAVMTQLWIALIHYLLVACIKFLHGFKLSLTKITNRIRDTLMQNLSLLEILASSRKNIAKHPDWNLSEQPDLFNAFSW